MTQEERKSLRFAWIEPDQYRDLVLYSNELEPLKEGEIVRVDPTWYRSQSKQSTVLAKVGKVFQVTDPQMALGEGNTYEEMYKNSHMVRMSWAEIAECESDLRSTAVAVVTGGPSDWLPGLDTMD